MRRVGVLAAALLGASLGCGRGDETPVVAAAPAPAVSPAAPPVVARGLRGRMTDPEGRPVAGARLVAAPWPSFEGRPDARVAVETTVADDGDFVFDDLPAGDWALSCSIGGAVGAPAGVVRLPDVPRLDVVLPFGATIAGEAIEHDTDAPIAGARVRAFDWDGECVVDVTTPADGKFEFLSRREAVWIGMYSVDRPGRRGEKLEHSDCVIRVGEGERIDLRASAMDAARDAATLSGVVTGPSGPVAGARVTVFPDLYDSREPEAPRKTTTDAAGRYEVADLPSGVAAVCVEADGLVQAEAHRPGLTDSASWRDRGPSACRVKVTNESVVVHDVALVPPEPWPTITATGRVIDEDGKPVAGATVVGEGAAAGTAVTTGADGAFTVSGVPIAADEAAVVVSKAGFKSGRRGASVFEPGATLEASDVVIDRGPRAHGRVSAAGVGVPGARVVAVVGRFTDDGRRRWGESGPFAVVETTTDAQGAYVLAYPYRRGEVSVHAEAAGLSLGDVHLGWTETNSDFAADFVLHPLTSIAGRVVRAGTGEPAVGVRLAVEPDVPDDEDYDDLYARAYEPHVVRAVTGADGAFRIDGVSTAKSKLLVLPGGAWAAKETILDPPTATPIVVEATPALVLDGRLAFKDGASPTRVNVTLRRHPWDGDRRAPPAGPRRETAADGRFVFRGLAPGAYVVALEYGDPEIASATVGPVQAGTRGWAVTVEPGRAIKGRIVGEPGESMRDALAWVVRAGRTAPSGGVSVEEDGSFEIGGLDAGAYDVHVQASGFAIGVAKDARAGAAPVEVKLERGLSIQGVAKAPDGSPLAGVRLCARAADGDDADWRERATRAGADGAFAIEHLPPGRWRIVVDENRRYAGPVAPADAVFEAGAEGVEVRCVAPPAK